MTRVRARASGQSVVTVLCVAAALAPPCKRPVLPRLMARARTVVLVLRAPVSSGDAERLHDTVRRHALDDNAVLVVCQVSGPADVGVVDALARIGLLARRSGLAVRVRCDSPQLHPLLHLCGLDEVLPESPPPPIPS